jgi:hypothetical protein
VNKKNNKIFEKLSQMEDRYILPVGLDRTSLLSIDEILTIMAQERARQAALPKKKPESHAMNVIILPVGLDRTSLLSIDEILTIMAQERERREAPPKKKPSKGSHAESHAMAMDVIKLVAQGHTVASACRKLGKSTNRFYLSISKSRNSVSEQHQVLWELYVAARIKGHKDKPISSKKDKLTSSKKIDNPSRRDIAARRTEQVITLLRDGISVRQACRQVGIWSSSFYEHLKYLRENAHDKAYRWLWDKYVESKKERKNKGHKTGIVSQYCPICKRRAKRAFFFKNIDCSIFFCCLACRDEYIETQT